LAVDLTTVCSTCVLCVPWLSPLPPPSTLFPYTTLFRSDLAARGAFRRDPGRRRRPTAHGTVVGVGDRERAVGQHRDTERVLQEGLLGGPVAVPEVEQPGPDRGPREHVVRGRRRRRVVEPEPAQRGDTG